MTKCRRPASVKRILSNGTTKIVSQHSLTSPKKRNKARRKRLHEETLNTIEVQIIPLEASTYEIDSKIFKDDLDARKILKEQKRIERGQMISDRRKKRA